MKRPRTGPFFYTAARDLQSRASIGRFSIFFSSSAVADLRNLTLIFDAIVILISDPKGPVPQNCGIMTIMTPGETGGNGNNTLW